MSRVRFLPTILALAFLTGLSATSGSAQSVKPPLTGLISMGRITFVHRLGMAPDNSLGTIEAAPEAFDGLAINVTWQQLQPTPETLDTSVLDRALADVASYNRTHPGKPLRVKLRVYASGRAPEWAKALSGGPVSVVDRQGQTITIGRFWTAPFQTAWEHLQQQLAARYDDAPLIAEVSVTGCTARADEPFVLPVDAVSLANLRAAGFTDAAYRACLRAAPDAYSAWKRTRIDFDFSVFRSTEGASRQDFNFTRQLMESFRQRLGVRAVLINHGLFVPVRPRAQRVDDEMRALGPDVELQMFSPKTDYWDAAVTYAAHDLKANAVEVWPPFANFQGFAAIPVETLRKWSAELKANPTR